MNDTFSFSRLQMLIRRQWTENKKSYLLIWGVVSLPLVLLSILSENDDLYMVFFLLFCFGGCAMTTTVFSRWTDFGRSSLFLLLPASSAEKFICGMLYGLVLYVPAYVVNYLFMRYMATYLVVMLFPNNLVPYTTWFGEITSGIRGTSVHYYVVGLLALLFTQSVYMVCVVRFRRWPVLYFLMIIMTILLAYNLGMSALMSHLAPVHGGHVITPGIILTFIGPDFGYYMDMAGRSPVIQYLHFIKPIRILNEIAWVLVFALVYLAAMNKLKEREL